MEKYFSGKVALVTGAASGIGEATALLYAEHGAKVIVSDIDETRGAEAVAKIKGAGGEAAFVKTDVSKPEECEELVKRTLDIFGTLDVACNNVGITGEYNTIADLSVEAWRKVMETNLGGTFYCMKYEIRAMLDQGQGGAIVNTSSVLGMVGIPSGSAYVAAKHGVLGLTKTAALEYACKDIRINAVVPGFIDTPVFSKVGERTRQVMAKMHPAGRLGQSGEVAELIIWLSSDKASFANGGCYPVDGGFLAR